MGGFYFFIFYSWAIKWEVKSQQNKITHPNIMCKKAENLI